MVAFRITKYNPALRDENGAYQKNEWTSVSDIGKPFHDGVLTENEYIEIENSYVEAVRYFLKSCGIEPLKVVYMEKHDNSDCNDKFVRETIDWLDSVETGTVLSKDQLDQVIRSNLREACFTKLEGPKNSYIHFGYDYYMFVGADCDGSAIDLKEFPARLFVEDMQSPQIEFAPDI